MVWLFLIVLCFVIIFLSSVTIGIYFKREQEKDRLKVEIGLLNGMIPIRKEFPAFEMRSLTEIRTKEKSGGIQGAEKPQEVRITYKKFKQFQLMIQDLKRNINNYSKITKRFFSKVTITKLVWISRIGTGDAAETGMLSGLAMGIKGSILLLLRHLMRLQQKPRLRVYPAFNQVEFYTELELQLKFRLGNLLLALTHLLINYLIHKLRSSKVKRISFQE